MKKEEFNEIVLKEKETRLSISRIPKKTKKDFVAFAEEEFEGDYGMTVKWCLEQAVEYSMVKKMLFENKLRFVMEKVNNSNPDTNNEEKILLLSGKTITKREVGK